MERWKVPLRLNHKFSDIELNRWLHLFNSPDCKVTQADDDGSYFLTACRFEKVDDADKVRESARKLTIMMIAFAKIELDMDFQSIEDDNEENIIRIIEERSGDRSGVTVYPPAATAHVFAMQPSVEIRDEHGKVVTQPRRERWYDYYLDQCDDWLDSTVIFKALSYFAQKTEARTVRLTYEIIRKDEGSDKALRKNNAWITKPELSRFTCSLNSRDIDSPELHAENLDPKCNMNISEARTFLAHRLLKPWLIKKRGIYKKLATARAQAKCLANKIDI